MVYNKRGLVIRIIYLIISLFVFLINRIRFQSFNNEIVLCYHGVKDLQKNKFNKQIKVIFKQTRVVSNRCSIRKYNFFRKPALRLTFDDAFYNLLNNVIPIISKYEIPILVFVPTGSLGEFPSWLKGSEHPDSFEKILSAEEISVIKNNPYISFGSHTVTHQYLSKLNEKEIRNELRNSAEYLHSLLDKEITELALPHGDYNDDVIRIGREEGYQKIYTLEPKANLLENEQIAPVLGRFSVSPDDWPIEFYLTINGAYSWLMPWRSFIRRVL